MHGIKGNAVSECLLKAVGRVCYFGRKHNDISGINRGFVLITPFTAHRY